MTISTDIIARVRDSRQLLEQVKQEVDAARQEWESQNQRLLDTYKGLQDDLKTYEDTLRQAILDEYAATGNKQPAPGCGVRVLTKLSYDSKQALAWAEEHRLALQLDKKAFEAIAKSQNIPFVEKSEEAQATIAQDLGKALQEVQS